MCFVSAGNVYNICQGVETVGSSVLELSNKLLSSGIKGMNNNLLF